MVTQDTTSNNFRDDPEEWLSKWSDLEYHFSIKEKGYNSFDDYSKDMKKEAEEVELLRQLEEEYQREKMYSHKGSLLDDNDILGIIINGSGDAYGY